MDTITSNSPEATLALGEQWAATARPGWVIGLEGDLGAGKTHLVKGIARGLGITGPITSPTFVGVRIRRPAQAGAFGFLPAGK